MRDAKHLKLAADQPCRIIKTIPAGSVLTCPNLSNPKFVPVAGGDPVNAGPTKPLPAGYTERTLSNLYVPQNWADRTSKWGASLGGDDNDLLNLMIKVHDSYRKDGDFFFTKTHDQFVLRSSSWDAANDSQTVDLLARSAFPVLVGCLNFLDTCKPFYVGDLFHYEGDNY